MIFPLVFQFGMALTDFSSTSLRDGLNGGVWRAVAQGLTGQEEAKTMPVQFDRRGYGREVNYVGLNWLGPIFTGGIPDVLVFNILWVVLVVGAQTVLGVGVALMLHRRGLHGAGVWRSLLIVPWAIPEFVGALVWVRIMDADFGALALASANLPPELRVTPDLADPGTALLVLLVAATWAGFPLMMLAASAGLRFIPAEVYDAAHMDGAGRLDQWRYITWPMLWPLVLPAVIIRAIAAFNQFYLFYAIQTAFPVITFATLSFIFFDSNSFFGGQYAVSAAINIFTVAVLAVMVAVFTRVARSPQEDEA